MIEAMVERYQSGENTREIGEAVGLPPATVWRQLKAAGVKMRPPGPVPGKRRTAGGPLFGQVAGYTYTTNRDGITCSIHRGYWEARNGPISEGHIVHHVNNDPSDNRIENLVCVSWSEHARLHQSLPTHRELSGMRLGAPHTKPGEITPQERCSRASSRHHTDINGEVYRWLVSMIGISNREMARATGMSESYAAQVGSGTRIRVNVDFLNRAALYIAARMSEPVVITRVLLAKD